MKAKEESVISEIFMELFRLAILIVFLNLTGKFFDNVITDVDKTGMILCNVIAIVTSVFMIIFTLFIKVVSRPIYIKVKLTNKASKEEVTQFTHNETRRQDTRTIVINVDVIRTNSLWKKLAICFLRKKVINLEIYTSQNEKNFICYPCCQSKDYSIKQRGFSIDIKDLILSNLKESVPRNKDYEFLIDENRDFEMPANENIPIKPMLLINDKSLNFFSHRFIKLKIDMKEDFHLVKYIK